MNGDDARDKNAQREKQEADIKESLSRIKQKLLVMSGKGGVGKSSVAVNIAVGLADMGYRVGLMDVDLHGPSIPQMLGIPNMNEPQSVEHPKESVAFVDGKIIPARYSENLSVVSIECLLENRDSAVIWRGPRKIGVIRQFISDVKWDNLDYLIIDSPPGTGDEPLTIAQTIADAQAIIVTTPQAVSIRDVRKSINFCHDVKMRIVGLIENLSGFACPDCGRFIDLFSSGGGEKTAEEMNVVYLGKIPIIPRMVQACDAGIPAIRDCEPLREAFGPILEALSRDKRTPKHRESDSNLTIHKEFSMKIAIPLANGKLAMHFGHCENFALVEVQEKENKILGQRIVAAPNHEPGLLPRWLNEQGANVIIAGGMGSRAQALFTENNIRVVTGAPAQEPSTLVMEYLKGSLITGGNVCDH